MYQPFGIPPGPYNLFVHFVGPNPPVSFNPAVRYPRVSRTAFISPFSSIIGDVTVKGRVYIAPNVSIRADEGTPFWIGRNTNIQDGVILHGLKDEQVTVRGEGYSIYIGEEVTCAHGSLIHGPCLIMDRAFIGFRAIVFHAVIGEGAFISTGAVVTNGAVVPPGRFVPPGANIDSQEKADALPPVPPDRESFAEAVQQVNQELAASYSLLFGNRRCSCGLACER